MKSEGFEQKFFKMMRMVALDKNGKRIDSNSDHPENESQFSDKYNLHGKHCSVSPYGDMIVIHRNFTQDGGLPENKISDLANEIMFILNKLQNTTPTVKDDVIECRFLAIFRVINKIKFDISNNQLFDDSVFDNMRIKRKTDSEIILNPDILENMNPNEINEMMKTNPELFSRKLGWNQIKVTNSELSYQINFEYKDSNVDKILEMIRYPHSYLYQIIKKIALEK